MQTPDWRSYLSLQQGGLLPAAWIDWLRDPGSFMRQLKRSCVLEPAVRVLAEQFVTVPEDERQLLGLSATDTALVREVLILSSYAVWMYARTVVPRVTLASKAELAELKDRSLGSVLFKDPTMQRGAFEIARIYPDDDWHAYIQSLVNVGNETFWARRSIFHVQQHPLLLTEVFLPDILTLTR